MAVNFLTAMALYSIARLFFYWMNIQSFRDVESSEMLTIALGGLRFDASALCYINILFVVMQTIPAKFRDTVVYQRIVKWLFLTFNSLGLLLNAADVVYFNFGGRRTTASFFNEFGNESNIGKILAESLTQYWQVWVFGVACVAILVVGYCNPMKGRRERPVYASSPVYYTVHSIVFVALTFLAFVGLRGGLAFKMHPLRQDSASLYIAKSAHAPLVLNTPFTILTTLHKTGYRNPGFVTDGDLDSIFCPVHVSRPTGDSRDMNVVVLLLEGFSSEYSGYLNPGLDGGNYKGYTPFLDSLMQQSYHFRYSLANGIRSVDAMPGVFAGIPRYIEPYCYFEYANNTLDGLPMMLGGMDGYNCCFYHGAPNTTLGFKMFTNNIGFPHYFGMDEYPDPSQFDGTWAIFDDPYLQYFARELDSLSMAGKPFLATVFTASSHQPFRVPDSYAGVFPEGDIPMHQVVGYSDYSLRRFFDAIKDKEWFGNTIFVVTADHTGPNCRQEYANAHGRFRIPIFFYTPGHQLPAICDTSTIMQQIDITPTLLAFLNREQKYFSFGKNVLEKDSLDFVNYAFNDLNGTSMYYLDSLMIEYSNNALSGIYEYRNDPQLLRNLIDKKDSYPQLPFMQSQMEAIIQQYVERMKRNDLHCATDCRNP